MLPRLAKELTSSLKGPTLCFTAVVFCLLIVPSLQAQALLDDFATLRKNAMGTDIWAAILSEDPVQSYALENGMFKLVVGPSPNAPYMHFFPNTGYGYPFPEGYTRNFIKSGSWNPNYNRLRFWVKCSKSVPRRSDGGDTLQIGTYIKLQNNTDVSWQGDHYYHLIDANYYANRWMMIEINRLPQHQVGNSGSATYNEDPDFNGTIGHYFDSLTRFYFDATSSSAWSSQTCYFDQFEFDLRTGEPESEVSSMSATYSGTRYEVAWAGPKNRSVSYEVRFSTKSMKASGFNSGITGGTVSNPGNAYTGTFWASPSMSEEDMLYVAIRPTSGSAFTEVRIPRTPGVAFPTTPPPTQSSPCDINDDGSVTDADIQLSISAAIGQSSCSADLDGDGKCTVVDTQRIVNSQGSGTCRTGL